MEKKVDALKYLKTNTKILRIKDGISKNILIGEAKNKLNKTKKIDKMVVRGELICRANESTYDFRNAQTTNTFGR